MVYNGTYSGLNTYLCAPHLALSTVCSTIWEVERGTYMAEWGIGDMSLNLIVIE